MKDQPLFELFTRLETEGTQSIHELTKKHSVRDIYSKIFSDMKTIRKQKQVINSFDSPTNAAGLFDSKRSSMSSFDIMPAPLLDKAQSKVSG
jgi:hypothetical protein